jgi:predicted ATPase
MLIKRLHFKKLLSFNDSAIELGALNVLIGPNAVGKSNVIEAISLLQAAPTSLTTAILRGGGVRQWIWLGDAVASPIATIECELELQTKRVIYELQFSENANGFVVLDEQWTDAEAKPDNGGVYLKRADFLARFGSNESSDAFLTAQVQQFLPHPPSYRSNPFSPTESLLSQYKNPADTTTPITEVGYEFSRIRIFREFRTGPQSPARYGISTSVPKDALMDGSDNLALVLLELDFLGAHDRIRSYLRRFCERFEDVKVSVGEGLARTYLREAGLGEMLSAIRMSDGTLKFLSLLAVLFHPSPPRLVCIEEPETGLHPDALQLVAEALLEASQSMQLIVTTHSEALVDALTDQPETVLVCERYFDNGTQMKRLSKERLKNWLEHYTLGQLWRKGEIGGGRW